MASEARPEGPSERPFSAPSLRTVLRVWLMLGLQSFGGGTATLTLIRQSVVEQQGWLSEEEFTRDWALCQITPGINLLALTILIGRRLAGARGIAAALLGLLLPSVTVTLLMTACYARVQRLEAIQAMLRGVLPATVGLGLLTAARMARPLIAASRREGRACLLLSGAILAGSGLVMARWHPPVILVLCAAATLSALFHGSWSRWRSSADPVERTHR